MSPHLIMVLLVHQDFYILGLLKFTRNVGCEIIFKTMINVKGNYSSSGLYAGIFSLLNSIYFSLDICFKIKKCFGQVNALKFGQI